MPFALPEYDRAFGRWFSDSQRVLLQACSPLLEKIRFVEVSGSLTSRVRDRDGVDVVIEPGLVSSEFSAEVDAIRSGDYERLYEAMYAGVDSMGEQLVGHFVESMNKITAATGNVTHAGGRPLDHDLLYETLEKLEYSLDENDELVMPSIVMHPDQAARLRDVPPPTAEQEQRFAELRERKREEALARRRRRRLS